MLIKPFPELENIHTIAIPLPGFPDLGTANVYMVGKGPISIIDTGAKIPGSLEIIHDQIKLAGFGMQDVDRIIITHGHIDHFGLAASIREAVGHPVECFLHAEDKWRLSSETFQKGMWSDELEHLLIMADMPQKEIEKVKGRFSFFKELGDPLDEVSIMEDGDEFAGHDYKLKVIHTPGHSPGSCCIYEPHKKILFSGDHIIKHISPNPFVELKRYHLRDPNYQSLREYLKSLDKLIGLDVRFVFPGHGEYIEDLPGIISTYKIHHHQRMESVLNALKKKPRPLYHLIDEVFPHVPDGDLFLAVSEIMVHLEILINEGKAKLADPGPPALYRSL